jgi:sec-independent protein translocase protein TatA
MNLQVLAFGFPGGPEWIVILIFALLIFGRRLPDVARSLGKSIVEFKKGIRDVRDDIDTQTRLETPAAPRIEQQKTSTPGNSSSPPV